jgi:hypothetical protein
MIQKKLFDIVCEAEDIEKTGFNERSGYIFIEEKKVKKTAKDLFKKHKVLATYQVTESNQLLNNNYKVTITYKFEDIEDNSSITGTWSGAGHGGDKGLFKAITGAIKSLLIHNLMLTSGEDPDDERSEPLIKPEIVAECEKAMDKKHIQTPDSELKEIAELGKRIDNIEIKSELQVSNTETPIVQSEKKKRGRKKNTETEVIKENFDNQSETGVIENLPPSVPNETPKESVFDDPEMKDIVKPDEKSYF